MSSSPHAIGDTVEQVVADRLGADRAEHADGTHWYDLETAAGEAVECKACAVEKSHGSDRTVPGEWWIVRRNHAQLVDASGFYALLVYREVDGDDSDDGDDEPVLEVVRYALLPARFLEAYISTWCRVGDRSDSQASEAAKVPHTRLFPSLKGDSNNE